MSLVDALPAIGGIILIVLSLLWLTTDPETKHKWILKWREIKRKLKL
jgi:hypothetical protein